VLIGHLLLTFGEPCCFRFRGGRRILAMWVANFSCTLVTNEYWTRDHTSEDCNIHQEGCTASSHNRNGTFGVMFCYHSRSGVVNFRTLASASTFQCWFVQSHIFSCLLQRYVTAVVEKALSHISRTVEARKGIILTFNCNCGFCVMKFARLRYGKLSILPQFWILTLDSHREISYV